MTNKAKTTTKAAPKAAPAAPVAGETQETRQVPDVGADAAADEVALYSIEQAQALPEIPEDAETLPCNIPAGAIGAFKSADRRTLRVVLTEAGPAAQA